MWADMLSEHISSVEPEMLCLVINLLHYRSRDFAGTYKVARPKMDRRLWRFHWTSFLLDWKEMDNRVGRMFSWGIISSHFLVTCTLHNLINLFFLQLSKIYKIQLIYGKCCCKFTTKKTQKKTKKKFVFSIVWNFF